MSQKKHLALVTDAWLPQVNGVVRTLGHVREELEAMGYRVSVISPEQFATVPCPTEPDIRLAVDAPLKVGRALAAMKPDHIHIATEGPLGWSARHYCTRRGMAFTTSFHSKFAEYLEERFWLPSRITYAVLRRFHAPAAAVLVTTPSMQRDLQGRGFANTRLWTRGVDLGQFMPEENYRGLLPYPRPIWLNVGRVAAEKNLEDFLKLDLPGTKLVVGDGPARAALEAKYPEAVFVGAKRGMELRAFYAGSDAFVFPSRTDTFGLVMLEALACGLPVAAYPVTGPVDVITDPRVGVLGEDLRVAAEKAITLSRADCSAYARNYTWRRCAEILAEALVPATS